MWIPSYIAYGLVDTMAPLYGAMAAPIGKLGVGGRAVAEVLSHEWWEP